MPLSDYLLYRLSKSWPAPAAAKHFGAELGTDAYDLAYARDQFEQKVRHGIHVSVAGMDVLEIGCGHGGISCFLAVAGARSVAAIDIDPDRLTFAERVLGEVNSRFGAGCSLPVKFSKEDATRLSFDDGSFDLVLADKVFEHFSDPEGVMREAWRVLRPGGRLLVPIFSSIYCKTGLHLKHVLKVPWANVYFSEKTILRVMHRLAQEDPKILDWYPGLKNGAEHVRDLRRFGDLNEMTYRRFLKMAGDVGFEVEWFRAEQTRLGKVLRWIPGLRTSILRDIFSKSAGACLRKPGTVDRKQSAEPGARSMA